MFARLLLVILPLLLPLLAHGAGFLLVAAPLASPGEYSGGYGYHAADVRPVAPVAPSAPVARSAPCKVAVNRPEARAYPRPVIPADRFERFRYSPASRGPVLSVPSVL